MGTRWVMSVNAILILIPIVCIWYPGSCPTLYPLLYVGALVSFLSTIQINAASLQVAFLDLAVSVAYFYMFVKSSLTHIIYFRQPTCNLLTLKAGNGWCHLISTGSISLAERNFDSPWFVLSFRTLKKLWLIRHPCRPSISSIATSFCRP
jgi:hypothetical protein